jgi:formylglycine-generating enzyme required for sulfatase activity
VAPVTRRPLKGGIVSKRPNPRSVPKKPLRDIPKEIWVAIIGGIVTLLVAIITGVVSLLSKPVQQPTSQPPPTLSNNLSPSISVPCPEDMVLIPSGDFWMGAAQGDPDVENNEKPGKSVFLDAFCIDKTEVSNAAYADFVAEDSHPPPPAAVPPQPDSWIGAAPPPGYEDFPVVRVSWEDAREYCHWKGKALPTEAQWEKAARGTDGRIYPWGNKWDPSRANSSQTPDGAARSVSSFVDGKGPYEVLNMSGNVAEWVTDWYAEDAYNFMQERNPTGPPPSNKRVVRGGSFIEVPALLRTSTRIGWPPRPLNLAASNFIGFRCAVTAQLTP